MTTKHSPTPWGYEFSPYIVNESGSASTAAREQIPAYEIFDAEGTKIFDTNENMPAEIQEANARLVVAFPALLSALSWITRCPVISGPAGTTAYIVSDERMDQARSVVAEVIAAGAAPATNWPFSVLLLYPDYLDDTGYETFYAFVQATGAIEAVAAAQRQAAAAQPTATLDPTDFHPLLVTQGHHASLPLFNR